jgi:hypothetical protein
LKCIRVSLEHSFKPLIVTAEQKGNSNEMAKFRATATNGCDVAVYILKKRPLIF